MTAKEASYFNQERHKISAHGQIAKVALIPTVDLRGRCATVCADSSCLGGTDQDGYGLIQMDLLDLHVGIFWEKDHGRF